MGTNRPLLDRIEGRTERRASFPSDPTPITERMSPFMRRLRDKQLPTKDFRNGTWTPSGDGDAA